MLAMKKILRNFLGGILAFGLIVCGSFEDEKKRVYSEHHVTALCFHDVEKHLFEKAMRWLKKNNYTFISTDQLIDIMRKKSSAPDKAVWITFDDGWKRNMENVIPVITKYNIPVIFFISTEPIENGGVFWWTYLSKYGKFLPHQYNRLRKISAMKDSERQKLISELENRFSKMMDRETMTTEDVVAISKLPQVMIGCHTAHHVIMPRCTEDELDFELTISRQKLENWTGKKVSFFAYPDGEFGLREKEFVQKYGFELAASVENRFINGKEDLFAIPRFWVRGEGSFAETKCQIVGIWTPLIRKIEKMFHIKTAGLFS
ncbi:MAG: polysaccharide deacetylase family protein [bacterium]|nr:polysaccharide deacetylase family protein [bacterium]